MPADQPVLAIIVIVDGSSSLYTPIQTPVLVFILGGRLQALQRHDHGTGTGSDRACRWTGDNGSGSARCTPTLPMLAIIDHR